MLFFNDRQVVHAPPLVHPDTWGIEDYDYSDEEEEEDDVMVGGGALLGGGGALVLGWDGGTH